MGADLKPGWYFFIECNKCTVKIAVSEAPGPEQEPNPMVRSVTVTCQACGTEDTYPPDQIYRGQYMG